ncbi:MAG: orotidine-5'-phosphate decarboxylase [Candidatus Margulisbacteria bacterium]|nr:orotidine-5'-phosphate decarboxylase [Candidatus Margulisiibacteriota bacterium]
MRFLEKLDKAANKNNSLLCVGLDIDLNSIPQSILNQEDPIYIFNREIINATKDLVCAYKPNIAFYERYGIYGLSSLIKTIELIHSTGIPAILDAKRGDIGHSSAAYAESLFNVYKADAVTVNPYLGHDSIEPFLEYRDKGVIVLCLTSNPGAKDFQRDVFFNVAHEVKNWNKYDNCGLVVGATKSEQLIEIRKIVGDMPILIPGVGTQGGNLADSVKFGVNKQGMRAIINSSRGIIYADSPREAAKTLRDEINKYRWAK